MIRIRTLALTTALVGILVATASWERTYRRHVQRQRAQPLIDLISSPVQGLSTSPAVAAADASLAPQVATLLRRGVPPNAWGKVRGTYSGISEFTPLMFASLRRFPLTVRVLIDAGAELNTTDREGHTALIWAVKRGNSEVVRSLLDAGADPNHVDLRGRTAIDYAYHNGYGWDNQAALLRPLKRVNARPGPYELRKKDPYERFTLARTSSGLMEFRASGDGITFHSDTTVSFPEQDPPLLTRSKYDRLRWGMQYPEAAVILGERETGGEMEANYRGSLKFVEGKRRIDLRLHDRRIIWKSKRGF